MSLLLLLLLLCESLDRAFVETENCEGKTEYAKQNLQRRVEKQQMQFTCEAKFRNEMWDTSMEDECSQRCTNIDLQILVM